MTIERTGRDGGMRVIPGRATPACGGAVRVFSAATEMLSKWETCSRTLRFGSGIAIRSEDVSRAEGEMERWGSDLLAVVLKSKSEKKKALSRHFFDIEIEGQRSFVCAKMAVLGIKSIQYILLFRIPGPWFLRSNDCTTSCLFGIRNDSCGAR